jgi:hypothetical protein
MFPPEVKIQRFKDMEKGIKVSLLNYWAGGAPLKLEYFAMSVEGFEARKKQLSLPNQ